MVPKSILICLVLLDVETPVPAPALAFKPRRFSLSFGLHITVLGIASSISPGNQKNASVISKHNQNGGWVGVCARLCGEPRQTRCRTTSRHIRSHVGSVQRFRIVEHLGQKI